MRKQPNILFIYTDEQRADSLGAYSDWAKTPCLDEIAAHGATFLNNYCQSPVCMPSRSSIISCMPVLEIGCLNNHIEYEQGFPEGVITFPEIFARNGYATGAFGKHHTFKRDVYQKTVGVSSCYPCMSHFELNPPFTNAEYDVLQRKTDLPLIAAGIFPDGQHDCAKFCVEGGIDFLENFVENKPWFLGISIEWPHTPVLCPRPFDRLYKKGEFKIKRQSAEAKSTRSKFDKLIAGVQNFDAFTDDELEWIYRCYYGLCAYVDSQISRLIDYLKEHDLYDDTIIVFASDHGRMLGEWGAGEKDNFDRPAWRTALIMSYAGRIPAGVRREEITENIDIGTTLLSLCGFKDQIPDYYKGIDLFDDTHKRRTETFGAIKAFFLKDKPDTFRYAMSSDKWRMDIDFDIYGRRLDFNDYDGSLYDLQNDPDESMNLFYNPEFRTIAEELINRMFEEFTNTKIDERLKNPEFFRFHRTWEEVCRVKIPKRQENNVIKSL
ncbi:MAG: sulfatase family protein [Saccharofermentanales bacterium]